MLGYKKGNTKQLAGQIPLHYPADRVYIDGDPTKSVQDKVARKADLTNLDLTGTTNTTGSTIASGTYFYLNGTLVRAKTAIASGATFTLNTNYEVVTVGDAINEILKLKVADITVTTNSYGQYNIANNYAGRVSVICLTPAYWCVCEGNYVRVYEEITLNRATNKEVTLRVLYYQ